MGGGKSSTATQQNTTNVQDIDTTTIGLEDVEFGVAGVGGNVSVTQVQTDQGAVDRAFDFGEEVLTGGLDRSLDFGTDAIRDVLDFGRENVGDVLDFGGETVEQAFDFSRDNLKESLDFGGDALDLADTAVDRSLDFGTDVIGGTKSIIEKALDLSARAADASNEAQGKALSALGSGITQVSDASRSDTTDAFRRIILYVAIAGGLAGVAYFAFRKG